MATWLWLTLAIPLISAVATRFAGGRAAMIATVGAAAATVPAVVLLADAGAGQRAASSLRWLPTAPGLEVGLRLDALSAAMSATVAGVGLVVVVYATGYFAGDERRPSALAGLLAFLAAMQGLVLADGYLAMLAFWELVGALSSRLIAWSRDDPRAPGGAVRAFLTTRTADIGFYLALLAIYTTAGTLAFGGERPSGALGVVVGLGLVIAAAGKSAQVPLQTWLSGAMAGPTPVSALLHSATMVAAGVYLLMRSETLLIGWPLELAGWIGAITAVASAAIALGQRDLKRVLAGSTTSQLGLMFVGMAAGGPAVALFHLIAHAAGKACLFLTAGVFQHNRGTTDLDELRGAGRQDRVAFAGFAIGALSIAAVPPLAGFWSKEQIAAAAQHHTAWFVLVVLSAAGSAAYLLRPALMLWRDAAPVARSIAIRGRTPMLWGVGALATASFGLAAMGDPVRRLLDQQPAATSDFGLVVSLVAIAAGALGVLAAPRVQAAVANASLRQLYVNELLNAVVVRPTLAIAAALDVAERMGLDRLVDGTDRAGHRVARQSDEVERRRIDAAVDGLARLVGRSGERSRWLESGRLYEYLRDTVLGAAGVAVLIALAALT